MRTRVSILLAASCLTTAAAVAATPSAANAGEHGCTGSLVGTWRVPNTDMLSGATYYTSDIKLYYNASTGWNCAVLAKRPGSHYYGVKTRMGIQMWNSRHTDTQDGTPNNFDRDYGSFKYYAGPVKVYGKNLCISMSAYLEDAPDNGGDPHYNGRRRVLSVACG